MIGTAFMLTLAAALIREATEERIGTDKERIAGQVLRMFQMLADERDRVLLDQQLEQGQFTPEEWLERYETKLWLKAHARRVQEWFTANQTTPYTQSLAVVAVEDIAHPDNKRPPLLAGTLVTIGSILFGTSYFDGTRAVVYWTPRKGEPGWQTSIPAWKIVPIDDQKAAAILKKRQEEPVRQHRFPEYNHLTSDELDLEWKRLEEERAGVGYGPKPVGWMPRSVSNPEIIERQYAIRTEQGRQIWQRRFADANRITGIPKAKHMKQVEEAIERGDLIPTEVLYDYPALYHRVKGR